jgi:hypothetical protein
LSTCMCRYDELRTYTKFAYTLTYTCSMPAFYLGWISENSLAFTLYVYV